MTASGRPVNGLRPVRASNISTPSAYQSAGGPTFAPDACSGAMYSGVPTACPTDEELCFVMQDVLEQTLGQVLQYGRAAYQSMSELYEESPEEFVEMFPGPCISARHLLLDDAGES
jgi:hypothetical protein